MASPLRIGLMFSYSLAHCRGMLRGIRNYARTKEDWIFAPVAPEPRGLKLLHDLGQMRSLDSVMSAAGINSQHVADSCAICKS
jgi:hypothetical protein